MTSNIIKSVAKDIKYYVIMFIFMTSLFSIGCDFLSSGSKVKGIVTDLLTGSPISDVNILAITKTDIEEDKKFEKRTASTNASGEFTIKGLSPKYDYTITATKPGFSIVETILTPPEKGKTKLLDNPLQIIQDPRENGVFIFSDGKMEKLQPLNFEKDKFAHDSFYTYDFYYLPKVNIEKSMKKSRKNLHLLIRYDGGRKLYSDILPLIFFDQLKQISFSSKAEWTFKEQKNIYIAGVLNEKEDLITGFIKWDILGNEFENPSGVSVGGFSRIEGRVPLKTCDLSQNGKLDVIKINDLPSGFFALENEKEMPTWVFGIQ